MPDRYVVVRVAPELWAHLERWSRPVHMKLVPQDDGTHELRCMIPHINIEFREPPEDA